jgi:AraC family transcriptional regulator, regulatory protein of adaptative response / methylated-DNA-[protein]-cysteine methyltransferase
MTPLRRSVFGRNRTVVEGEVLRYGFGTTSVAAVGVVLSSKGIVAIAIRESPDNSAMLADFETRFPGAHLQHDPKAIRRALNAIVEYIERPTGNLALPLDVRGSDFQRRVWGAVMEIPFGNTTTFAQIAKQVGSPRAVRAVGNACSRNPIEFAIPCHRVLRSDGSYSGGSQWGDRRQATIVQREANHLGTGPDPSHSARGRRRSTKAV